MPQDSLRSIVYRSFITCDDPSGFFECKTIRKSKTVSQRVKGKTENVKSRKSSVAASSSKEGREEVSSKRSIPELDRSSSVHIKKVSMEAEELSKVVDSLSKGSFDSQSEDIAKNLLRGALSLQESLLMLGKLQGASTNMANLKKYQKENSGGGKHNGESLRRSYSEKFDHNNVVEFQKARLSVDGSSRDCYEELREAIRESFARQNLLPKNLSEEKVCSNRNLDLSPDIASACSSQSSVFSSHDFVSFDSSSSNLQPEKLRGPNVIAKLMGLEEFTSKQVESTLHNQLEKGKISKNKRPVFDIDLPNARKPSFIIEKPKPEQRTLAEIIEIMEFKGLTKSKFFEGSKLKKCHSNVSDSVDDAPPIVLIKPLHNSGSQKELPYTDKCTCGGKTSGAQDMLKLWKISEGIRPKNNDLREKALNSIYTQRTVRAEKNVVERIGQEKRTKDFGEATARPSDRESKIQDNLSSATSKVSVPVSLKPQKKEVIDKKVDKIQRMAPSMRRAAENNQVMQPNSRISIAPKAYAQGKINSIKVNNSRGSTVSKKEVAVPKSVTSNPISKSRTIAKFHNTVKQKKNVRSDKLADKLSAVVVGTMGHKEVDAEINPKSEKRDNIMETTITSPEQLSCEEVRGASDHCAKDDSSMPCKSTMLIIPENYEVTHNQIDKNGISCNISGNESRKAKTIIRDIVLSSASFLNRAEELFDTTSKQPTVFDETSLHDYGMADAKLILDCANELLECKCQQWSVTVYPLLQHPFKRLKFSISFDLLVAGICNGIENLESYSKLSSDILLIDTIYAALEMDLWGKGVVTRTWDFGWKNGFTQHEVEEVVVDIEELLVNGIIEDLLLDFPL